MADQKPNPAVRETEEGYRRQGVELPPLYLPKEGANPAEEYARRATPPAAPGNVEVGKIGQRPPPDPPGTTSAPGGQGGGK